tara:strand:+ start:113 stop:499 length:387 start_codon:yes stop_codon:yes gene_type:complete
MSNPKRNSNANKSNNIGNCIRSYEPKFLGTIPKGEIPRKYQLIINTNKPTDIKCPMCSGKCFYPLLEYHKTYTNGGNNSKATALAKTGVKSLFLPKLGRLSKCLSCTKCGYMNMFREFSIIKEKTIKK